MIKLKYINLYKEYFSHFTVSKITPWTLESNFILCFMRVYIDFYNVSRL